MNSAVLVCLFVVFGFAFGQPGAYTTKYDGVDLNEILRNDRLLNAYCNCLLNKGHCTPDGLELKKILPDALETGCSKCNQRQKDGSRTVLRHLIQNKPQIFAELEQLYDPAGNYKKKYCKEAKQEGIKLNGCN